MPDPKVLVFAGSLRAESLNKRLARLAAAEVRAAGGEPTLVDLRDYPLPLFDEDLERDQGLPASARRLKDLFIGHAGLYVACPEYNASLSAVLKNAFDWVSRQHGSESGLLCYEGKVAALCGATPGQFATLRAMEAVRQVLMQLGCNVLARRVGVARAGEAFDEAGALRDPLLAGALRTQAAELVRLAAMARTG